MSKMSKQKIEYKENANDQVVSTLEAPEVKQEVIIEFDDEAQKAYFTTQDGVEVEFSCPKMKQLMKVKSLLRKYKNDEVLAENADDLFSISCITKYGKANQITISQYQDLCFEDVAKVVKCLSMFQSEFEKLQSII